MVNRKLHAIRVGDFYEFYGADAEVAAKVLEITLTGRNSADGERIAMSGFPYHSAEKYIAKLSEAGFEVVFEEGETW